MQVVISNEESVGEGATSAKIIVSNEESVGAGATCAHVIINIQDFCWCRCYTVCAGVVILFKNMCVQVLHVWWSLEPVCHGHHPWHNSPMRCRSGDMLRRFRFLPFFSNFDMKY